MVARVLKINPGDPLSPTAITETQRRLYDLGVFAKVDAAIENPDAVLDDGRRVELQERAQTIGQRGGHTLPR